MDDKSASNCAKVPGTISGGLKTLTGYMRVPHPPGPLEKQGAEARLYAATLFSRSAANYLDGNNSLKSHDGARHCVVKERFIKSYRQAELDVRLSGRRLRAEARLLLTARQAGVPTPALLYADTAPLRRQLWLARVPGCHVPLHTSSETASPTDQGNACTIGQWIASLFDRSVAMATVKMEQASNEAKGVERTLARTAEAVGHLLARLHAHHIVHGDLTLANILVRMPLTATSLSQALDAEIALNSAPDAPQSTRSLPRLVLIDFGLSSSVSHTATQRLPEEKAVELYVFERAVNSFLPRPRCCSFDAARGDPPLTSPEGFLAACLVAYSAAYPGEAARRPNQVVKSGKKRPSSPTNTACHEAADVLNKLEEVRLRGRKRLMIG